MHTVVDRIDALVRDTRNRLHQLTNEWLMFVTWTDLLLASWPVAPDQLRRFVPQGLELDTFDGSGWISIVPFTAVDMHFRGLPPVPGQANFCELNCRMYVRSGAIRGVLFLSLDCPAELATLIGRHAFHLPFKQAQMSMTASDGTFRVESRRVETGEAPAAFIATYRPAGEAAVPESGTLEQFLTSRFSLFIPDPHGHLQRGDIAHAPWMLQKAEVIIETNTIAEAVGLTLPTSAPHVAFAARTDSLVYPLVRVETLPHEESRGSL